jgi:hypothetical protein
MNWSEKEVEDATRAGLDTQEQPKDIRLGPDLEDLPPAVVRAIMTRAVSLAAGRGGAITSARLSIFNARILADGLSKTEQAELLGHAEAQGARVAALEAELSRLKPSGQVAEDEALLRRDLARLREKLGIHPRHVDAMSDSQDALSRLAALASDTSASREATAKAWREAETLRTKAAELEADLTRLLQETLLGAVAGDLYRTCAGRGAADAVTGVLAAAMSENMRLTTERDTARAEVERLKAELDEAQTGRRLMVKTAEKAGDMLRAAESRLAAIRERVASGRIADWVEAHGADDALARWILEGDSPQEAKDTRRECTCVGSCRGAAGLVEGWRCVLAKKLNLEPVAARHPCSPTCTHDDAATPGHPERVKQRSEAVTGLALTPPTEETPGVVLWSGEDDQPLPEGPLEVAYQDGCFEQGAEAMRSACLKAVQRVATIAGAHGLLPVLKAAIEGAAP